MLMPNLAISQEFDWKSQLGASLEAFENALGSNAYCDRAGFSVPVGRVDLGSVVDPDLFDPIRSNDYKPSLEIFGQPNLHVDNNRDRYFRVDGVKATNCTIGKEATVTALAFNEQIFRISIRFDRCETRVESEDSIFSTPGNKFMVRRCRGVDLVEKPFDRALYKQLKDRGSYTADKASIIANAKDEQEKRALRSFNCRFSNDAEDTLKRSNEEIRCLMDVDGSDRRHWSALAVYEFYQPGIISYFDVPSRHLAANRLFVDLTAQAFVIESMRPGLQKMVDEIKETIAARIGEKESIDSSVSDLLGAGN